MSKECMLRIRLNSLVTAIASVSSVLGYVLTDVASVLVVKAIAARGSRLWSPGGRGELIGCEASIADGGSW